MKREFETLLAECPHCEGSGTVHLFEGKTLPSGQRLSAGRVFSQPCTTCFGEGEVIVLRPKTVHIKVQLEE